MRLAKAVAVTLFAICLGFRASSDAQTADEVVKAQFVYRFTSFVQWPHGAFESAQSPIVICVVGAEGFHATLSRAVARQQVGGRSFQVRRIRAQQARNCHVAYVAGFGASDALHVVRRAPVLTITDAVDPSGGNRGIIHFVVVDNRVRFHVDDAAAAESELSIDPRLLSLALSVRRRTGS